MPGESTGPVRIIKHGGDDVAPKVGGSKDMPATLPVVQDYKIGPEFVNPVGMPSGPGFDGGKRKKRSTRTYPRGILRKSHRIIPSKNPSKSPPTRKRAVLIVSEKKIKEARKTAKQRAAKTDLGTIRRKLIEKKIISPDKKNIPPSVLRTLYADAVGAGLMN